MTYFKTLAFTVVYSSNLGFDEFIMISIFLQTLKLLQQLDDSQRFSFKLYGKFLLDIYLRLAPIYYLVFLFGWLVGPFLGYGSCWFAYSNEFSQCNQYFWSVFTMTINFIPSHVIANEGCFYWGWFVPCLLQLALFLPFIVFIMWKL